jgi:hypothetical protein
MPISSSMGRTSARRFSEAAPGLAAEIENALREMGEENLAHQVPDLLMLSPCGCGDAFCASFHTGVGRSIDRTVPVEGTEQAMVALDESNGKVIYVEVITEDFSKLRDEIRAAFGQPPQGGWSTRTFTRHE